MRKFFLAFLHVFFGLKPRDVEEIKSRVKPLNPKKGKELSKDIKDKDENKYDEKKDADDEEDEGKRDEMDLQDEDKDADTNSQKRPTNSQKRPPKEMDPEDEERHLDKDTDTPSKHKDGGKDGERVLGGVGRRTRRSSRGEKEDEGRDGDDPSKIDLLYGQKRPTIPGQRDLLYGKKRPTILGQRDLLYYY